jgi:hypothetical protein
MLLMIAAQLADPIAATRELTRADARCTAATDPQEIIVCGRRDADRYRVTFIAPSPRDSVPAERARLLEPKVSACGRVGQFFADCGFVGMSMTTGAAGTRVRTRKLAD